MGLVVVIVVVDVVVEVVVEVVVADGGVSAVVVACTGRDPPILYK